MKEFYKRLMNFDWAIILLLIGLLFTKLLDLGELLFQFIIFNENTSKLMVLKLLSILIIVILLIIFQKTHKEALNKFKDLELILNKADKKKKQEKKKND